MKNDERKKVGDGGCYIDPSPAVNILIGSRLVHFTQLIQSGIK